METLQQEMARMQEHNNILASKLDDTQRQLQDQQTQSTQLQNSLERTIHLRQEKSIKSVQKPSAQDRGKQQAADKPTASRRLFVPSPKERHPEYRVYSDCRDRINDRRKERQPSPIRIQAKLNDRRLEALGPKSHLRQRYRAVGLEETDESDYVPTSPGTTISYRSPGPSKKHHGHRLNHEDNRQKASQAGEPFGNNLPSTDPTIRLLLQKMNRIEEEQNQARTPTWGTVQPGPFTHRIRTFRHEKEVQALRISFYSGVEDPVTHIHTFQSALGCKGLTDEGQCLLFPSTLTGAALNWFYRSPVFPSTLSIS